jgi:hypothetical protein
MGMFDSIQCNYPLPLPLEIVDIFPDVYNQEFQTKDLENLLDNYILNEDGELLWVKKEYKWVDDEDAFLKGYMEKISEEIIPSNFHGILNFYCYETVHESGQTMSFKDGEVNAKDVSIDYLAKFTNGKIDFIEVLSYEVSDASVRLIQLKENITKANIKANRFYNKYLLHTKFWKFIKWKIIIKPIELIKKISDKIYWLAVRYL